MIASDNEILTLLYRLAGGALYCQPSYTSITEFTDNFPKQKATEFLKQHFPAAESAWQPEKPYPCIYNKHYRKSILSTLRQTIEKT